jgi:hypothetical protein
MEMSNNTSADDRVYFENIFKILKVTSAGLASGSQLVDKTPVDKVQFNKETTSYVKIVI